MILKDVYDLDDELNSVIDDLLFEDELFEMADPDNSSSRLSIRQFEYIMRKMYEKRIVRKSLGIMDDEEVIDTDVIVSINRGCMIRNVMDFLKSIDISLHVEALKLFTGISRNQEIKFYNYSEILDFKGKDENGFALFEESSMRMTERGMSKIYIVLFEELNKSNVQNVFAILNSKDDCSFKDMFKLVHELAHGFDKKAPEPKIDLDTNIDLAKSDIELPKTAENFLSETTAILFEHLLGDFLIEKNSSNKGIVKQMIANRIESSRECALYAGIKSSLMVKKIDKGLISKADFLDTVDQYGEDEDFIRDVLKEDPFLFTDRKYAMALLLVPTMLKKYREDKVNGNKRIMEYLDAVKRNDFTGALSAFDISFAKKGVNELLVNLQNFEKKYLEDIDLGER